MKVPATGLLQGTPTDPEQYFISIGSARVFAGFDLDAVLTVMCRPCWGDVNFDLSYFQLKEQKPSIKMFFHMG